MTQCQRQVSKRLTEHQERQDTRIWSAPSQNSSRHSPLTNGDSTDPYMPIYCFPYCRIWVKMLVVYIVKHTVVRKLGPNNFTSFLPDIPWHVWVYLTVITPSNFVLTPPSSQDNFVLSIPILPEHNTSSRVSWSWLLALDSLPVDLWLFLVCSISMSLLACANARMMFTVWCGWSSTVRSINCKQSQQTSR